MTADLAAGAGDPGSSRGTGKLASLATNPDVAPGEPWESALAPVSASGPAVDTLPAFLSAGIPRETRSNAGAAPIAGLLPARLPEAPILPVEALPTPAMVPPALPAAVSAREPAAPAPIAGRLSSDAVSAGLPVLTNTPLRLAPRPTSAVPPGSAPAKPIAGLTGPADLAGPLAPEQALAAIAAPQRASFAPAALAPAGAPLETGGDRIATSQAVRERSAPAEPRAAFVAPIPSVGPLELPEAGSDSWARVTAIAPLEPLPAAPSISEAAPSAPVQPAPAPRAALRIAAAPAAPAVVPSGTPRLASPKPPATAPLPAPPAAAAAAPAARIAAPVARTAPAAPARDASRIARVAPAPAAASRPAAASAAIPAAAIAAALPPRPREVSSVAETMVVRSRMATRIDGKSAGSIDFLQSSKTLKVRVGALVEILSDRFDASQLERIRSSSARDAYLSLAELQAQGIPISYDPVYDEFNIGAVGARPKAARKVYVDQISAPERGAGSLGIEQVRP